MELMRTRHRISSTTGGNYGNLQSMASVVNGDISRRELFSESKFNVVCGVIANETGQSTIDGHVAVTEFVAAVTPDL